MSGVPARVYVHVPFCARRCSYCDFSIAVRRDVPVDEFLNALAAELTVRLGTLDARQPLETLYFGGGTPSHLGPDGVARLLELMRTRFTWSDSAEVTLEANPDDVTASAIGAWRSAGVTRVSLGAQSFDEGVLRWMHRSHTPEQIHAAVALIRDGAFESWSFDLIFALPSALKRDWERDLSLALSLEPPHLSLYGLTVEPGTPLARWSDRGEVQSADEGVYEQEFLAAHAAATSVALDHYEVSNFARPGHEARHNRAYWQGVPYLGLGPSAHGFAGGWRRWNVAAYSAWRDRAIGGDDPIGGREFIGAEQAQLEAVYLGLRTTEGLAVGPDEARQATTWISQGWAILDGDRLRLTPLGWLRLDSLATALTPASGVR
jgi:oxygen-independent coproporphyrinogen III oxidase